MPGTIIRRVLAFTVFLTLVGGLLAALPARAEAACTGNAIACENEKPGTPANVWDIDGAGDLSIQGFSTQMSVDAGSPVQFKIDTDASAYSVQIYRLGWYQGDGARLVDTVTPSAALPQTQQACATDESTQIVDCGTWAVSASWSVPADAVSGVYIARLVRTDNGGASHIPFVVRNDGNTSKVLFQTSDTTWQAYNTYGGASFYAGGGPGRGYKLSYNRPFSTRAWQGGRDFLFANEYPMIRYLEQNGYDVSYVSGLDTSADPNLITKHKAFLSVGHDEYWSQSQRQNVTAARDAGVNLAFFSGNDVYWKTRWEPSQDGSNTANRTLVCYKDTWANTRIDPVEPTATWRDPRFGDLGFGPENALIGTQFQANFSDLAIKVSADEGKLRLWSNTSLASQSPGSTATLAAHTVGYESNEDVDNGFRPAGLARLSTTIGPVPEYLTDFGNTVAPGTTTHHLTQYRAASGALVFSAGTVQWAWGLDSHHDGADIQPADPRMRQATANILADMSALPTTLADDLTAPTKSSDTAAPTSAITSPSSGADVSAGDLVTVKGTAADVGGGQIAGVEVSVDGGATFHPADGRESWEYTGLLTGTGPDAIQVRAVDDSANLQATPTKLSVAVTCPCSLFGAMTPVSPSLSDSSAVTLGTRFSASKDGFITGIRFYKGSGNTGAHVGSLYDSNGTVLAQATFGNETSSGWQTVSFSAAVPVDKGSTYVAAYYAPNGGYAGDQYFFGYRGYTSGYLTAPGGSGNGNVNGVFAEGQRFPTNSYKQTNYYVDAIFNTSDATPLTVVSASPLGDSTSVPTDSPIRATFAKAIDPETVNVVVIDGQNNQVPGSDAYNAETKTVTFTPTQSLATATTYSISVTAQASSGIGMAAPFQWSFTTAKAPGRPGECPCTLFDDSDGPTTPPASDTDSVKLGVAFRASSGGTISGIRFYKAPGNSGSHTVSLWSASGDELATATVQNESAAGWQEASFGSPVAITANTTYIASYLAPNGRYSMTPNGLAASFDRGPLTASASGGRYTYGSGAPTSTSTTNYWVDPVFGALPGQAPQVVSTSPGDNATSVAVTSHYSVTFDTTVQAGSASVSLKRTGDGVAMDGSVASESSGMTVTFVPAAALDPGTEYTLKISGAKSIGGTSMASPVTVTFTTSGAQACPCSLMESTTVPSVSDSGDGDATTLGLKFTSSVDGFVKGLRYYRDAANTGTHVGRLWAADGTQLATVTFDDSGTGWQQASFSAPVAVTAGSTYVAGYYAPQGHYSVQAGAFSQPMVNTPLSSVGSGSVYRYGNSFPNETFMATNYFVDVLFTPASITPPAVTDVSPNNDATSTGIDSSPTATFTRAITASSLEFALADDSDQLVSGQVSYDPSDRTATYTPAAPLQPDTTYTATVSASSASGAAMTEPKEWSFTTADTVPPVVTSTAPAAAAADVQVGATVEATFARPVNAGSVALSLKTSGGQSVAGATAYDATTRKATFTPTSPLDGGTTFTATVTAKSSDGVAMADAKVWSFATVDTAPAGVGTTTPADQATGIAVTSPVAATFDKAITQSTLAFSVKTAAGASVTGATTYSTADRKATFTPSASFAGSTKYSVSVSASSATGVAMTSPKTWSFTTADISAPTVTTKTPAASASGVTATTKVTAVFDKAITGTTLVMSLKTAAGAAVAGSTSYEATTRTATFTPTAALTSSTGYTASVRASSAAGVAMAGATTWTFTTAAQSFSLFTTAQAPTAATTANGTAVARTVGVRFTSSRAGKVTAIRYYAASTNTGTTVSLWNATGTTRLATATTTGTGTGWRTATFATPVTIAAGTTYVASYYAPVGRNPSTSSTFSTAYTKGPLTVAASGSRSSLGNTFPSTSSSANFWVDVLVLI